MSIVWTDLTYRDREPLRKGLIRRVLGLGFSDAAKQNVMRVDLKELRNIGLMEDSLHTVCAFAKLKGYREQEVRIGHGEESFGIHFTADGDNAHRAEIFAKTFKNHGFKASFYTADYFTGLPLHPIASLSLRDVGLFKKEISNGNLAETIGLKIGETIGLKIGETLDLGFGDASRNFLPRREELRNIGLIEANLRKICAFAGMEDYFAQQIRVSSDGNNFGIHLVIDGDNETRAAAFANVFMEYGFNARYETTAGFAGLPLHPVVCLSLDDAEIFKKKFLSGNIAEEIGLKIRIALRKVPFNPAQTAINRGIRLPEV